MKLSDAIALGRTLGLEWDPNLFLSQDGCRGCAIGMALKAMGKKFDKLPELWPWLSSTKGSEYGIVDYRAIIGSKFIEVCHGTMTLDELIDYIRSVEPPEPADKPEPTIAEGYARINRALNALTVAAEVKRSL